MNGETIQIASDDFENVLLRKAGERHTKSPVAIVISGGSYGAMGERPTQSVSNAKGIDANSSSGEAPSAIDMYLTFPDPKGSVSDQRINQFIQEFGVHVQNESDLPTWSFTTIDFVDKNGKIGCTTTTDEKGNFVIQKIPDGIWKPKVSK